MKQTITVEQFQKLTPNQQIKLPLNYPCLLSIGEMIELLSDKQINHTFFALENIIQNGTNILIREEYKNMELCDILWEEVKRTL